MSHPDIAATNKKIFKIFEKNGFMASYFLMGNDLV